MREVANRLSARPAVSAFSFLIFSALTVFFAVQSAWASQQQVVADDLQLAAMSDEELGGVAGGDLRQVSLDDFNMTISNNQAGYFTMDIAQSAFDGAQGVFTTLQTVNSAVNFNLVVNIYLNAQSQSF